MKLWCSSLTIEHKTGAGASNVSRKWERMVEKNRKKLNEQRSKQGKGKVKVAAPSNKHIFHGRNIIVSILCLCVSLMFLFGFEQASTSEVMYWLVIVCYFALGLYFFFLKRPYIKISKVEPEIAIRKLGKEKVTEAAEIEHIHIQPGIIAIKVKDKRSPVVLTRVFNLYSIKEIAPILEQFAQKYTIEFKVE